MMILRRQTSAIVALAAAYAMVSQPILLTIRGSLAERQALSASSLCTPSHGGEHRPAPPGHGDDCLSACLACCCGMAAMLEPGEAPPDLRGPLQRIAARRLIAVAALPHADRAHRSRGPPLA
jgi:hypothetical protein